MIKVLPESEGKILILGAMGKLTDEEDKDVLIPGLESIIHEHGKARLLLDMGDQFLVGRLQHIGMTLILDLHTGTILKRLV